MTEPRPPKRERTRRKLIDAGLQVMAERGEALTASDVQNCTTGQGLDMIRQSLPFPV